MSQPAIDEYKAAENYLDDFETYAKDFLVVRDQYSKMVVPFVFNKGQKILHTIAEKQKAEKGFIRIIFLKSRRFGGSTYVEGRFYWLCSLNYNRNVFIVAHEKESTNTLFEMAKLMQEQNPVAPPKIKCSEKALKFDTKDGKGLKSEYRVATAENLDAGKSQGIHYLHCSEEAMWRQGRLLLAGLLPCIPKPPIESEIFRESTANGYGDSFQEDVFNTYSEGQYPYYQEGGRVYAWNDPDNTEWILVFIPWFTDERNTTPFKTPARREAFEKKIREKVFDAEDSRWVDSYPLKIKRKFKLTLEQLYWRDFVIRTEYRGDEDRFKENYPSTVEEAFLADGGNYFGQELCDQVEEHCEPPLVTGNVVDLMGKSRIRANKYGKFKLWEKPDKRETYFLTIDSAGGKKKNIDKSKKGRDPDKTVIDVWNHRTGVQAAQWQGDIDYDLIADLVVLIGRMFFTATACVELFNHGYTVVAQLKAAQYPMYEHKPGEPGWPTTGSGKFRKTVMCDTFYQMARDAVLQVRCKETVSEMRTFMEESGHLEAATGCKDDRVITAAMASQMMTLLPKKFRVKRGDDKPFTGFKNFEHRIKKPVEGDYQEYYA